MKTNISSIWDSLIQDFHDGQCRHRLKEIKNLECYGGYNPRTKVRYFSIIIRENVEISPNYFRKFNGVQIVVLPIEQKEFSEYSIMLMEEDLLDVFSIFIEDVLENIEDIQSESEAITQINQVINYWTRLFGRLRSNLLSKEEQKGLYGELYTVKLLLENTDKRLKVIESWRGPSRGPHDFAFNESALEVKTTSANEPSISISTESQVDYEPWQNLFIIALKVFETGGSGSSLTALINEIAGLLSEDHMILELLFSKLDDAGIDKSQVKNYDDKSYVIRSHQIFKVSKNFPRIDKKGRKRGVYDVKYRIDLSACTDFEVLDSEIFKIYN